MHLEVITAVIENGGLYIFCSSQLFVTILYTKNEKKAIILLKSCLKCCLICSCCHAEEENATSFRLAGVNYTIKCNG